MRAVATRGRWIWGASGLVTTAVLVVPGIHLIASAGQSEQAQPQATASRTVTVPQPVTSVTVQSYGGPVQVTAGPVRHVQITEIIMYDPQAGGPNTVVQAVPGGPLSAQPAGPKGGPGGPASGPPAVAQSVSGGPLSAQPAGPKGGPGGPASGPPAVAQSVSGGHLNLAALACASSDCSVSFALTVPSDVTVTVTTQGGPVSVSGIAGANLDSGGGPVSATEIDGPLTVVTGSGSLLLDGLAGPLRVDTGGGPLAAQGVASATATVTTGGGDARLAFSAAPDSVTVSTDGGDTQLAVPGGPYALTADSGGGPQSVGIATDPAAHPSITVISGGGALLVEPPAGPG